MQALNYLRFNEFLVEETIKPENKRKRKLNCESYGLDTSISKENLKANNKYIEQGKYTILDAQKAKKL